MSGNNGRKARELISQFCKIILTKKDNLNIKDAQSYIESLTEGEKDILISVHFQERSVHCTVRDCLTEYILQYQGESGQSLQSASPFEFDTDNNLFVFKDRFKKIYTRDNPSIKYPVVFDDIFNHIDEMSEHYRVFEQFYVVRSQKTTEALLSQARNQTLIEVQKGIVAGTENAANLAAEKAKEEIDAEVAKIKIEAKNSIQEVAKNAIATAEETAKDSVKDKIQELTFKTSEHSVTILSIFAGIVLTVVAGLFYSSSVLASINEADFYRLVSVSALIGFVCFNLIAIMFRFLERIRTLPPPYLEDSVKANLPKKAKISRFSVVTVVVSSILLIIMVVFALLHIFCPLPEIPQSADDGETDVNVSGELNVSVVNTGNDFVSNEEIDKIIEPDDETMETFESTEFEVKNE